ncbi:MAG: SH3 domain-containing protein [Deltaproteobacteria bacterium]|nr:SH3 domain-containing protein [Deltaproteobacteria bacterium]MCW5806603.1 SH3 domain-containing protein [Deltaproteobacteria bacterium]
MKLRIAVLAALLLLVPATAAADAYLRVISQKTPVRTGPGPGYREVYTAERGQVFAVLERATRDFWFKVELDDGTSGWILGDAVFPFEVNDATRPGVFTRMGRAIKSAILGPSGVSYANVGLSFSAGILDREGVFILRPSWIIDPYWAIEAFGGLSPRAEKDIFLGGLGFVLRLAPGAVIGPYASIGVGAAKLRPKADNFIDKPETLMALGAGGGLEITFKKQITLRLDARNWTLFDENKSNNGQEYSGGLAIFF